MNLIFKSLVLIFFAVGCSPEKPCSEITDEESCNQNDKCRIVKVRKVFFEDGFNKCEEPVRICTDYYDYYYPMNYNYCKIENGEIIYQKYGYAPTGWQVCTMWQFKEGEEKKGSQDYCAACGDGYYDYSETCDWSVPGFDVRDCSDYNLPGQYTCSETCQWQPEECFE